MYKDAYGIRPRHVAFDRMTLPEIEAEYDDLAQRLLADARAEEQRAEKREEHRLANAVLKANMQADAARPLTHNPFAGLTLS